nr:histone deacetylase 14 [Tanacetum cinerariifolium]
MPHIRWIPIGKSNCYLDVEKLQSNPIYKITVDILKHTNFFRAFTASSTIPSIYIQQFWDTVRYNKTFRCYKSQLDEQWFDLTKDTLRDALQITPVNNNKAFSSHPSSDALINFVNELGYPKLVKNLSNVKKATLIVISSIKFTKLIIYHLQRKHKFHPRPDSPLHLPNEEPVLVYLKFSAKETNREVFGMPIPGNLIIVDIQGKPYYQEYLEKVAKHKSYLTGEQGSDPDSPASKPAKATKKSKTPVPKADPRPPVTKPASSQQPEPKPALAKSKGKKRKLVTETSDKPSPARRSKSGLVSKRHKPISSLRSVDESVAEGIPKKEPRVDDEEADIQRALEESLKSIYDAPRGLLRTGGPNPGDQDEGQAGLNPDVQDEGQAGPNPGDAAASQPLPSLVVHAKPNLEHIDLEVTDVSTQPQPEQMDEGFTATAYPKSHVVDLLGWWMEVDEVMVALVKIQKLQEILKFQMDLLVVKEEVDNEVETMWRFWSWFPTFFGEESLSCLLLGMSRFSNVYRRDP